MKEREEINSLREFTIFWNNNFVLDYWYRQKHNIAFNSKRHRALEPISIMFEWEEDQLSTVIKNREIMRKREEDYRKTGRWLLDRQSKEIDSGFYDNLDSNFFEQFDDKQ